MLRIYLMRHSSAGQTNKHLLDDHDRPLTKKGEDLCAEIARDLDTNFKDYTPNVILSSSATRAKQTAELIKNNSQKLLSKNVKIESHQELYITGDEEILNVIRNVDENFSSILVISHSPGLLNFALNFAGKGDKIKYREMKSSFPPGSFAVYEVDETDWKNVKMKDGTLLFYRNAKDFKKSS